MEQAKFCGSNHKESDEYFCHCLLELNKSGNDKCVIANNGKQFPSKQDLLIWLGRIDRQAVEFELKDVVRKKTKLVELTTPTPTAKKDTTKRDLKSELDNFMKIKKINSNDRDTLLRHLAVSLNDVEHEKVFIKVYDENYNSIATLPQLK